MPSVTSKVLPMSPVHLLPMSPVYTPLFAKGDVNPPMLIRFKRMRFGQEWVELISSGSRDP